jgi:hypothetical protein
MNVMMDLVCVQADYMADETDPTSDRFLEVYLLWLFGGCCSASQRETRCRGTCSFGLRRSLTHPSIRCPRSSRGSAVLAATYRGLCSILSRPASKEGILPGCPLLLQMWIHERFNIGRPKADFSEYQTLPEDTDPANLPTMGSLWCL